MSIDEELQGTINELTRKGRGILAADESTPTITKRFKAVGAECTEETRRAYRELLLTTAGIGEHISGVILYEETLGQTTKDGVPFAELARRQGIVPGIKVDKGLVALPNAPGDKVTQGLDGLGERLIRYKQQGARFAKWRNVYPITSANPTPLGVRANAEMLARYAALCQEQGLVPIVEPEVLIDGEHTIGRCAEVTEAVQHALFHALHRHRVKLEFIVLKPNMVTPGKGSASKAAPEDVARHTVMVMRRTVPAAVPTVNFLSGGQTPEEATRNLNAMNVLYPGAPWVLSFSFARALQDRALAAWRGDSDNTVAAQDALLRRARLNGLARHGQYAETMETTA